MTAAVPDPRECQTCGYDEANHKREAHPYRPAAVPAPRFRDQLVAKLHADAPCLISEKVAGELADALMPTIAAEVEARVQAAANQRAAEVLRACADSIYLNEGARYEDRALIVAAAHRRAAALASPAPAPRGEEGQR